MDSRKGQGATEYLMVFGAVLLIAIVAVVLFGFFPQLTSDALITSSNAYWRSEALPFAITDHQGVASNGTFYLRLENAEARENLTVTGVSVGGGCTRICVSFTPVVFKPGESKIVGVTSDITGNSGDLYQVPVNISYYGKNGIPAVEYGTKDLIGRYT